jgi:hypothetical protein
MTFTYAGDPSASTLAALRFLIGDTITGDQQLSDEEKDETSTILRSNVQPLGLIPVNSYGDEQDEQGGYSFSGYDVAELAKVWNTRPIEDALTATIAQKDAEIKKYRYLIENLFAFLEQDRLVRAHAKEMSAFIQEYRGIREVNDES